MWAAVASHVRHNIIGYVALFIALSGTAYAATALPKNSVTSATIVNGAVKTADLANSAVTESKLDPAVVSSLTLHCPAALHRAGDICFEPDLRTDTSYTDALAVCARAQLRLPSPGELALAFDHLTAPQMLQWVSAGVDYQGFPVRSPDANLMGNTSSRNITTQQTGSGFTNPYRCVTSASN
jgi:hypothetical protein